MDDLITELADAHAALGTAKAQRDEARKERDEARRAAANAMHRISQMEAASAELMNKLLCDVGYMPPPVADSVCSAIADFKDVFNAKVADPKDSAH